MHGFPCRTGRVETSCFGTGCETPGPPPFVHYFVHFLVKIRANSGKTVQIPYKNRTFPYKFRTPQRRWLLAARQVARRFHSGAIGRGYSPSPAGGASQNPSISGQESSRSRCPARSAVTLQRYLTRNPSSVDGCQKQGQFRRMGPVYHPSHPIGNVPQAGWMPCNLLKLMRM